MKFVRLGTINEKWEVQITISPIYYYEQILEMSSFCDENQFEWWHCYDNMHLRHGIITTLWHFTNQENAMQFELAWG